MKKIILTSIICFVGSISLNAQSKATTFQSKETKMESQIVTNSHSQIAEFRMGINGLTPKMKMDILLNSNTPIKLLERT
jgi:hypothetical protein